MFEHCVRDIKLDRQRRVGKEEIMIHKRFSISRFFKRRTPRIDNLRTDLKVANLGESKTNCTASNKFDLPLPFRPTTQLVVAANGWISGCWRKERKLDMVICLICILLLLRVGDFFSSSKSWLRAEVYAI